MPILYTVLAWFARYLVLKTIALFAVGIFAFTIIQFMFERYVNAGLQAMGGIGGDLSALIGIAHLDKSISIVLGAYAVRAAITALKMVISKA